MEVERQFLVNSLPPLPKTYDDIRQGYVALLPEIRIRQIGSGSFALTVKRGAGLIREEWETAISREEFDHLSGRLQPGTFMIEKRRYLIPLTSGHTAELHIHKGHLDGFKYAEVEFSTAEEARAFIPPAWFGCEVTDDARFSYGALARSDGMEVVRQIMRGG